jgi:phosphatidate cytidylyltransferase
VLLAVPALAAIIGGGPWTAIGTLVVGGIALIEFVHLVARRGHRAFGGLMLVWMLLFVVDRSFPQLGIANPGTAILMVASLVWALARFRQGTANAFTGFAMTLAGSFYIGWTGAHLISIRQLPDGLFWTLTILPSVWIADSSAYIVGRLLGRERLIPDISPGKTWAGYIGAVVITPLAVAGLTLLWRFMGASTAISPIHGLIIGLLVGAISPVGDLGISMLKRYVNAKDSSHLIPGHGGFLDRIDAALVAILLGYYYVTLIVY